MATKFRFALRKQAKIQEALGKETLDRILKSLKTHFENSNTIETQTPLGARYPLLIIDDVGRNNMMAFHVVGQTYNVYRLAFKEFFG